MSAPTLAATCFLFPDVARVYTRLADVLEASAAVHCPTWQRDIERVPPPSRVNMSEAFDANVHKMTRWCARLETADDGDAIVFMDADTVIVQPLDPIWSEPFDLAYTVKPGARYPFNTGVVAVRVSDRVRTFFRAWHDECRRMQPNTAEAKAHHRTWRRRYGGIHQAALGCVFAAGAADGLQLATLPCRVWNCEDLHWTTFDPAETRILHVKSGLRRAVLGFSPVPHRLRPAVAYWRLVERRLLEASA